MSVINALAKSFDGIDKNIYKRKSENGVDKQVYNNTSYS